MEDASHANRKWRPNRPDVRRPSIWLSAKPLADWPLWRWECSRNWPSWWANNSRPHRSRCCYCCWCRLDECWTVWNKPKRPEGSVLALTILEILEILNFAGFGFRWYLNLHWDHRTGNTKTIATLTSFEKEISTTTTCPSKTSSVDCDNRMERLQPLEVDAALYCGG